MSSAPPNGENPPWKVVQAFMNTHIPFNQFLGVTMTDGGDGFVRLEQPFREELLGDVGRPALHGGVISTLVDVAGGAAAFTRIDFEAGDRLSTVDLRVDYLRPAGRASLVADAEVVRMGNHVAMVRVKVSSEGVQVAEGVGVYSIRRGA